MNPASSIEEEISTRGQRCPERSNRQGGVTHARRMASNGANVNHSCPDAILAKDRCEPARAGIDARAAPRSDTRWTAYQSRINQAGDGGNDVMRKVADFLRKRGSSGWTRTSNPPVNSLMPVLHLVGSSVV